MGKSLLLKMVWKYKNILIKMQLNFIFIKILD